MVAMKRCLLFVLLFALGVLVCSPPDSAQETPSPWLAFQQGLAFAPLDGSVAPSGWFNTPPGTVRVDNQVVHSGKWSVRFDRNAATEGGFSVITRSIPVDFSRGEG